MGLDGIKKSDTTIGSGSSKASSRILSNVSDAFKGFSSQVVGDFFTSAKSSPKTLGGRTHLHNLARANDTKLGTPEAQALLSEKLTKGASTSRFNTSA